MEGHLEALLELIFFIKTSKFWSRDPYRGPTGVAVSLVSRAVSTRDDARARQEAHVLNPWCEGGDKSLSEQQREGEAAILCSLGSEWMFYFLRFAHRVFPFL
jgi:hypothetical protein